MLHYGESQIFSPVAIYPFWTAANESLEVQVISDRWTPVKGTAQLSWYTWNGTALNTSTVDFTVPSLNSTLIYSAVGLQNAIPSGFNDVDVFLIMNLTAHTDSGTVTNEAVVRLLFIDSKLMACFGTQRLTHSVSFSSLQQV